MLQLIITVILMVVAMGTAKPGSPPSGTSPWAKEPEYFRAMEYGFRLDATHHHIHFVDRGKPLFISI